MANDLRPNVSAELEAFGVPATITRKAGGTVTTTGIWLEPQAESLPVGHTIADADPMRVFAVPRSEVLTMSRGDTVAAAEVLGRPARTFKFVRFAEASDPEFWYLLLEV